MPTHDEILARIRPDVIAAREAIRGVSMSIVNDLGRCASLDGAVFFALDNFYGDTAATVEAINTEAQGNNRFAFQHDNVSDRRVDLHSSAVGATFQSGAQQFARSRMNPDQHTVYGIPIGDNQVSGVLQLAFTEQFGALPEEHEILSVLDVHRKNLGTAAAKYFAASSHYDSIGDALLLHVPTTPNSYMVEWDLERSTELRDTDYPLLRNYLTQAAQVYQPIFDRAGGRHIQNNGDGQTYRIELPYPQVDRNNLRVIGKFGTVVVARVMDELFTAHNTIAENYGNMVGPLRVAVELGRFEGTNMGESGPGMWDLAKASEAAQRGANISVFGEQARAAFDAAA